MARLSVTVFGAGPSGLMAAWACRQLDCDVRIIDPSPTEPDGRSAGVFYLHDNCGMNWLPTALVTTSGEPEGYGAADYRRKLYGEYSDSSMYVSFPEEPRTDLVYDGVQALHYLWTLMSEFICEGMLYGLNHLHVAANHGPVISTVPLDILLMRRLPHTPAIIQTGECSRKNASVTYNADLSNPVYRDSKIFGRRTLEHVPGHHPKFKLGYRNHTVKKVQPWDGVCYIQSSLPPNVLLAGRYGAWDKSCLTHNVYERVQRWIQSITNDGTG